MRTHGAGDARDSAGFIVFPVMMIFIEALVVPMAACLCAYRAAGLRPSGGARRSRYVPMQPSSAAACGRPGGARRSRYVTWHRLPLSAYGGLRCHYAAPVSCTALGGAERVPWMFAFDVCRDVDDGDNVGLVVMMMAMTLTIAIRMITG